MGGTNFFKKDLYKYTHLHILYERKVQENTYIPTCQYYVSFTIRNGRGEITGFSKFINMLSCYLAHYHSIHYFVLWKVKSINHYPMCVYVWRERVQSSTHTNGTPRSSTISKNVTFPSHCDSQPLPQRDGVYFLTPWIWPRFLTSFDHNVRWKWSWNPQSWALRSFVASAFPLSKRTCHHEKKPSLAYWRISTTKATKTNNPSQMWLRPLWTIQPKVLY